MITSHHSFSTRIFLNEAPAAHASAQTSAAASDQPENLKEFWWFLRSGRGQIQQWRRDDSSREAPVAKPSTRGTGGPASKPESNA